MRYLLFTFFILLTPCIWAQEFIINGTLFDSQTKKPISEAYLFLESTPYSAVSLTDGKFSLKGNSFDSYTLIIQAQGYKEYRAPIEIDNSLVSLNSLLLEKEVIAPIEEQQILLTETELEDNEDNADRVSGLLQSSRDIFMKRAAFDFGQVFFKPRGYDSKDATVLINGIPMNKIDNGRPQWSNWGGLNDITRNQELSIGLQASDYTFGGLFGSNYISIRPSLNRTGLRLSASASNRSYNGRVMATYNSGVLKSGLSYSLSASRRWAPSQGYVQGTQYNAYSVFGGVEYNFNAKNSINLIGMFTPNRRGKSSPITQEVIDLAGYTYNPMWGYQNGNVRNSRQKIVAEPIVILSYQYNNGDTRFHLNLGYQSGTLGNTRIKYANAQNPEPNYYKNLPSYYLNQKGGPERELAELQKEYFLKNEQLNWEALYAANMRQGGNGRSMFIVGNDKTDETSISGNTTFTTPINENIQLTLGATYRNISSKNHAEIEDLLGGWFYMNKDYFSGLPYNSLEQNLEKRKGQKFEYYYLLNSNVGEVFSQLELEYGKANFFVAGRYHYTDYQREGKYKNPSYTDSYGKGKRQVFNGVSTKAGITYSLTGRHLLQINIGYFNTPKTVRNTFANTRNSNRLIPNLNNDTAYSIDGSYILRMPYIKAKLTGYYTYIENASETSFFYTESSFSPNDVSNDFITSNISRGFVTQTVKGIDKQHFGIEFGAEVQIVPTLKATTAIALGQFTYANNPSMLISSDEIKEKTFDKVYFKNYHVPSGPQRAYSIGLEYRSPRHWWVAATANYLTHNYISLSAINRTTNFYKDPDTGDFFPNIDKKLVRKLLTQERLPEVFLLNVIGGKSWRVKSTYISLFMGINNLLGQNYKSGGFEQSRTGNYARMVNDNSQGVPTFGPRYFLGYGRTYFVNLAISL